MCTSDTICSANVHNRVRELLLFLLNLPFQNANLVSLVVISTMLLPFLMFWQKQTFEVEFL